MANEYTIQGAGATTARLLTPAQRLAIGDILRGLDKVPEQMWVLCPHCEEEWDQPIDGDLCRSVKFEAFLRGFESV